MENNDNNDTSEITANHEVCVTSKENLPKPIAFAKILRSENIKDILRIKYKSANKVLIQCQRKEDALKLTDCKQFKEMGLRCELIQEMSVSYGIVKGIDLELSEEELMSIFKNIMSEEQVTYRRALQILKEKKGEQISNEISQENNDNQFAIVTNNEKETYSSVLTRAYTSRTNNKERRRTER
ncbi:hypothetical protein SFRURICE_005344 [Spodoptera frugiperda]|nr:hypothetical protein SFRURICE_005344 [Spodoptera frugiperda]